MSEDKADSRELALVDKQGKYSREILLHEVLDRSYLCGMLVEESVVNHPYFKEGGAGKDKAEEALAALWSLYLYLKTEEHKATGGKTSDHD
jgi:hypothetical protein